jgi:hypothetical protein
MRAHAPSQPHPGVTKALADHTIATFEEDCSNKLTYIVDLVRGNLTNLQRITLGKIQYAGQAHKVMICVPHL